MLIYFRRRDHRYCAFCKVKRMVYLKKHVDLTNVVLSALFAASVTFVTWGTLDPQGIALFAIAMAFSEIFIYMRWRLSLVCSLCGFDPITYRKSPALASKQVNQFFKEQIENPEFWLTKSPLLILQKRIKAHEKKTLEHQIIMSRKRPSSLAPTKAP